MTARGGPKASTLTVPRLPLESGDVLFDVEVAYRTWGALSERRDNAVLVEHALTGSPHVDEWWGDVLGHGKALDPERDFVLATNVLGSCYGTTGPTSRRQGRDELWGADFPRITVRDMVNLEVRVAEALDIEKWALVIGGSLGGMRALEWAVSFPERVGAIAVLGAPARHSAWAVGWNAIARSALLADPKFREGRYSADDPPKSGLAAARATSMLSYRSFDGLHERFARRVEDTEDGRFEVERWLDRHGATFVDRFDANSWLALSRAMDTHDVVRGRGEIEKVLAGVDVRALFVGISSDVLYPAREVERVAALWPSARYELVESIHGHDAFLIEGETMNALIKEFRDPSMKRSSRSSAVVH